MGTSRRRIALFRVWKAYNSAIGNRTNLGMADFLADAGILRRPGNKKPTPMKGWAYARFAEAERFDGRISFDGFTTAKNLVIGS